MPSNCTGEVELFTEAINLPTEERVAFLDRACAGDQDLRCRIEKLLRDHDRAGEFMEAPLPGSFNELRTKISAGEKPGDRIGRYKLLRQIGEGGCGIVFMAEQQEPVRRRVALKVIKPGMDTKSVIARFEAERQALALMDHSSIARVFDAGATDKDRPYFVMELVEGVKITDFCDRHSLPTRTRLELFVQVCDAIQHAHQKGIIHRDIKPSNILVTIGTDGKPVPKVIDFGIAKAVDGQHLTNNTIFTANDMLIGTPAYMSPEQVALAATEVDTRTDIYSLGVLLYELLTGATPFDARELLKAGFDEVRRVVRQETPVRPSTRLSTMREPDLMEVCRHRHAEPSTLIRQVRGDLDWIAMMALEKDRTRRYETASGLALDVKRFLGNEGIMARPPSRLYKFKKLVLRHTLLFGALAVIALLMLASLIVVSTSLAKEHLARRDANAALGQAKADQAKAETEAAKSHQITAFLEEMLQGVGPSVALGQDTAMLRGILERTAERVGKEMTNQPSVEAELRSLIGQLDVEIGSYAQAEQMERAALALNRRLYGAESKQTAAALYGLGDVLWHQRKLAEAESAYVESLAIRRHLFGSENPEVAATINNLGAVYRRQRKLADSEAFTREALTIRKKLFGNEHLEVADSLRNLCIILAERGKQEEAQATAREMLAMRRRLLGNDHPLVASALMDLAWVEGFNGSSPEIESMETEAFGIRRKLLGDDHPDLAKSIYSLGEHMRRDGKLTESHAMLNAALSIQSKLLGDDHPEVLATLRGLALTLEQERNWANAERVHREALVRWRKRSGNESPEVIAEIEDLIRVLVAQRKAEEANELLNQSFTPALVGQQSSSPLLALRMDLKARRSQWQDAAADAAESLRYQPNNPERYFVLAALLAKMGDHAGYKEVCVRFFTAFHDTSNLFVCDNLAKSCLLLSSSGVDLNAIARLADTAVTAGARDEGAVPFLSICKALSEYRLGHFASAAEWAQKALKSSRKDAYAHAYGVLALADWRLGKKDDARAVLAAGEALAPHRMPDSVAEDPGRGWLAWLFARIQLGEAEALINSTSHE